MTFAGELIRWEAVAGEPLRVDGTVLVPVSRVLTVRLPSGLVRHRPIAVRVDHSGLTERVPIRDVTRTVQLALLGAGLVVLVVGWAAANRQKELIQWPSPKRRTGSCRCSSGGARSAAR